MQFLNRPTPSFLPLVLASLLLLPCLCYELTLTNNATFPLDGSTFYFNNRLVYENSSFFYLVQIQNIMTNSILQIDQSHNNNVSSVGNLLIDNFNVNTFFLAVNTDQYLAFIYDLQSESGLIGTLLIVNKQNFSESYMTSLYSSYIAAEYLFTQEAIVAVSTSNQITLIIDVQYNNASIVNGPTLSVDWTATNGTTLIKSSGENYLLVFSLDNTLFQLLQINGQAMTIISQNIGSVSSVCFIEETSVVVHKDGTISFYSLPAFTLQQTANTNQTQSSYCYHDTITDSLIFVYQQSSNSIFWSYDLGSTLQASTAVIGYTEIYLQSSNLYLVDTHNNNQVSYSFFDYQSCHHSYLYDPDTFNCYQCPGACQTCSSTQFCFDCFAGNYFIDDYCCGNSQYYQIISAVKNCFNCAVGCYNCTNATNCIVCRANNYFIDNYCCGNSQYYLVVGSNKSCHNCPTGCYNCSSSQYCYTCKANNIYYDNYCCGVSQYYLITNGSKGCLACPTGCYNCSSSLYCYSCKASNNLIDNYCCGIRQYYLSTSGVKSCHACPTGCYNCSSASVCLSCSANYVMVNNFCCRSSQYLTTVNGTATCRACPTGCDSCSSATQCNSCNSTWLLGMNNICYNSTEAMLAGEYAGMQGGSTVAMQAMADNEFTSFFNSVPSVRGFIQSVFGSFVWFDQLYLFQYHKRNYGLRMNLTFQSVQEIQTGKWQGINWMITDQLLKVFGSSMKKVSEGIDYKKNYTSSHFKSYQPYGQGLFPNAISFLVTVTLVTLLFFLGLRAVFFLLFRHRWSIYFRSFSFWPYFIVILMQGNLLQLIFFACGDLRLSFSHGLKEKLSNFSSWVFLYFLTAFSVAIFPLLFSSYRNNTKYFCYNIKFKKIAIIYLVIQVGFRNLFQAMIHYFLKDSPYFKLQFLLLILCQAILCANYFFFLSQGIFNYKFKVWLSVLQSFTKSILIGFLYLRMDFIDIVSVNYKTDSMLGYVVAFYMVVIYVNMGVSIAIILREFIQSVYRTINRDERERMKGITDCKEGEIKRIKQQQLQQACMKVKQCETQVSLKKNRNMFFFEQRKAATVNAGKQNVVRIKRRCDNP